jgi:hypothetical protein
MECSGFFAGHLSKLRLIFPDSPVIYLKRPPEAWITSVINYFSSLADSINYNYVCRILFDRVCFSHPIDRFFSSDDRERSLILKYLLEYWIRVYEEAVKDPYALIIPLTDVDARIEEIEDFISMRACSGRRIWKRENPKKESIRLSRYIDLSVYKDKLARHGY